MTLSVEPTTLIKPLNKISLKDFISNVSSLA